jgi:hypothetical protein
LVVCHFDRRLFGSFISFTRFVRFSILWVQSI